MDMWHTPLQGSSLVLDMVSFSCNAHSGTCCHICHRSLQLSNRVSFVDSTFILLLFYDLWVIPRRWKPTVAGNLPELQSFSKLVIDLLRTKWLWPCTTAVSSMKRYVRFQSVYLDMTSTLWGGGTSLKSAAESHIITTALQQECDILLHKQTKSPCAQYHPFSRNH